MKSLQEMLKESFEKSYINDLDNYIVEGLNIDIDNKTVSLTDAHNSGIDFSLVNNPVYDKHNGYDVISIFKRTSLTETTHKETVTHSYMLSRTRTGGNLI